MNDAWTVVLDGKRPASLAEDDLVMVRMDGGRVATGPHPAKQVDWNRAVAYLKRPDLALRDQLEDTRAGHEQAVGVLADQLENMRNQLSERDDLRAQLRTAVSSLNTLLGAIGAAPSDDISQQIANVAIHIGSQESSYAKLCAKHDSLAAELAAVRAGSSSALNLQRAFLATAEVREARAQRDYASVNLDRALLLEHIATSISRGHLPDDFHAKLREWSK